MKIISVSPPLRSRPAQSIQRLGGWAGRPRNHSFPGKSKRFPSYSMQRSWIRVHPVCNTGLFACG